MSLSYNPKYRYSLIVLGLLKHIFSLSDNDC